ncbi:hypothetical protein GCM10023084_00240 [Streptomyces lacrimifluminis]|uniref:Integral membrane protein n=1 Tax=Streptomyces lacrimifluminis TaxID=1500077 RepID=A0A917UMI9_9ACTN|nr:hypothetical protein [Streptomyces lacrimifluminis]GGJ68249.1 hypothetical protein GCM10012282_76600 [Streptomyces lacrimifluminis]
MSGSIWMPPGAGPATLPAIPRQRTAPSWAEPDPIDQLAARLDEFIAAAVHPDEIAALLESDGLSDDQIRERYGVRNSFALAEELYDRVERRYPEPEGPAHDPWQTGLLGCLLRGVVFALPGLGYVLGAPLLAGPQGDLGLPAGTIPLLAGALVGWTWNQGLAHRAYSWLSLGDRPAARRSLLLGAPAGALLGSLVALSAVGTAGIGAVAFAAGQSCYLAAATALLVLGRERALLAALLPMAAGAVLAMIRPVPDEARAILLLGSLIAVVILGLLEVTPGSSRLKGRGELRDQPQRARRRPTTTGPRLAGSLPYALFGLGSGILVLYAALGGAPAAVALTLSMGPAEWLLHRFRSDSLAGLRSTSTSKDFWRTTAATLVKCLSAYLAALLALSLAVSALWPHAPGVGGIGLAGLLLLGVVLWTGLLLQSAGAVLSAAVICCVAALAQTLALATHAGDPHWVGLIVYGTAAGVQAALVSGLLGRATAHR